MAKILIDIKEKTKEKVLTMAFRKKVTIKKLVLDALGLKDEA